MRRSDETRVPLGERPVVGPGQSPSTAQAAPDTATAAPATPAVHSPAPVSGQDPESSSVSAPAGPVSNDRARHCWVCVYEPTAGRLPGLVRAWELRHGRWWALVTYLRTAPSAYPPGSYPATPPEGPARPEVHGASPDTAGVFVDGGQVVHSGRPGDIVAIEHRWISEAYLERA